MSLLGIISLHWLTRALGFARLIVLLARGIGVVTLLSGRAIIVAVPCRPRAEATALLGLLLHRRRITSAAASVLMRYP